LVACHSASCAICRTTTGLLNVSTASSPLKPLACVESGRSWYAERFSTLTQEGQEVVNPQGAPLARSRFAAAPTSGQVFGAISGSRPAARNIFLL
jgi:hypothetical protein